MVNDGTAIVCVVFQSSTKTRWCLPAKYLSVFISMTTMIVGISYCQVKSGYYLVQTMSTFRDTSYGSFTLRTKDDSVHVESMFSHLNRSLVDGIEYESVWFGEPDITVHKKISTIAKKHRVDLWESDWRLQKKINQGAFGEVPKELAAYSLKNDGTIQPYCDSTGKYFLDLLNPLAVDWLLDTSRNGSYGKYLKEIIPCVNGYLFDETRLMSLYGSNEISRPPVNSIFVYSNSILSQWIEYCAARNIKNKSGEIVTKYPVPDSAMVNNNPMKLEYAAGYQSTVRLMYGKRFNEMPKDEQLWKNWYSFIAETFTKNYLARIMKFVHLSKQASNWKGITYFQNIPWGINYTDPLLDSVYIPVKERNLWGAWSYSYGVDLRSIASIKELSMIICESYQPTTEFKNEYFSVFKNIAVSNKKQFGLLVHNDDGYVYEKEEERKRWESISTLKPSMIVRFPSLPLKQYYQEINDTKKRTVRYDRENEFLSNLMFYRKSN